MEALETGCAQILQTSLVISPVEGILTLNAGHSSQPDLLINKAEELQISLVISPIEGILTLYAGHSFQLDLLISKAEQSYAGSIK